MGSDETAIIIPGGPRVIDVFYGNGAPSGPNYLIFSGTDRLLEAYRGRSGLWVRACTAYAIDAAAQCSRRALEANLGLLLLKQSGLLREIDQK